MALNVHQFRCLTDNYGFLVRDSATGAVAAVDTPDANAYVAELDKLGWKLDLILNTHWHPDHTGGNLVLKERYGALVAGPAEVRRATPVDRILGDGDSIALGGSRFEVIDTGGHTIGHVSLYAPSDSILFVGDTLFPLGCGRMFEGTPPQFERSLARLAKLPEDTIVYAAHEYTAANLRFALSVDDGPALKARASIVRRLVDARVPTVPTTIGEEKATNPFLRASLLPIAAGAVNAAEAFRIVREAKDKFVG